MSSSPLAEPSSPSTPLHASTPNFVGKKHQQPLSVGLPPTPVTPPVNVIPGEPTLTPPPRSPGVPPPSPLPPASPAGEGRTPPALTSVQSAPTPQSASHTAAPDGTSSDKSSETAVVYRAPQSATALPLTRKESYKAQRQHYRREKKRAASALLHSIDDPVLADWLKVRGSLKSWTKLWCVLKPGLLLLYKSPKAKSSHWVGTVLLTSCQVIERPSKKDGFCFKLYHPLEQSIWAPRGPHNETIGAVVQPLPTAHLIFRAPSQAAGHCWLDGLELALRCSNAMLRCGRPVPETAHDATQPGLSHEELEKHFNEHELAGAASESDSDGSRGMHVEDPKRKEDILARLHRDYVEDTDREIGAAGELVEEVAEENKSLLWFLLKQVRPGMDLSKVVLPTFILEPRSFLDKLSDSYYHSDILAIAPMLDDPYLRFLCVLRWYLSGLYKKPKGLKKPYNPVLGETFRCCWRHPDQSCTYYVAEQVSHHPPVSAFYVSNRKKGFIIEGSLLARSKFYGNSTSAILEGCARVHLLPFDEVYVTTAPYAHCKGIVIGTLSMELGGKIQIICNETGYQADVEFKLRSFLGGADQTNCVSGRIRKGKDVVATVDGYWDGRIDIKDKKTGEESVLLDCAVLKHQRLQRYLMRLDQQHEHESQRLWIKVSEAIAREDQVAATEEKTVIEEAQRVRARNQETPWVSRIFYKSNPITPLPPEGVVDQCWKYNHGNPTPWELDEVLEYEEDYVIQSLRGKPSAASLVKLPVRTSEQRESIMLGSDSESHDPDAYPHRQSKTSTRSLKQTLMSIDSSLREQSIAIERLSRAVDAVYESQRVAARPLNVGALPTSYHVWDIIGGFVLALILQSLLRWIF